MPATYGNSDLIIRYNKIKNTIDFFNIDHLMNECNNNTTNDNGGGGEVI